MTLRSTRFSANHRALRSLRKSLPWDVTLIHPGAGLSVRNHPLPSGGGDGIAWHFLPDRSYNQITKMYTTHHVTNPAATPIARYHSQPSVAVITTDTHHPWSRSPDRRRPLSHRWPHRPCRPSHREKTAIYS